MSNVDNAVVDMYEQLPVPFGLVRFGVAPDHPDVKNCQDKFTEVASSPNFNFVGNIDIGKDLQLASLQANYNAVVFAYGASKDRKLGINGEENLKGIYSARAFVGWYNGLPEYADLAPNLSAGEEAIVVGQGNVALDIARTLLCDIDRLRKTDMTEQAVATFSESRVKRVRVVGRRGPMQASFTIKEVRELMNLPSVMFEPISPSLFPPDPKSLPRTARRLTELLQKGSTTAPSESLRKWSLDFFLSPTSFNAFSGSSNQLSSMTFAKNQINDDDPFSSSARVSTTGETVTLPTSVAFRSIGYRAEAIPGMQDIGIPFDTQLGVIPNDGKGRIFTDTEFGPGTLPGMYCSGWVKRGPTGVIASTMEDAFSTAEAIAEDWETGKPFLRGGDGWEVLKGEIKSQKVRSVTWEDWKRIDAAEKQRGMNKEKEREKITRVEDMLKVLD
ncbi:MAG: NADPH-adrenodoxin reductase [Heterodermia speciosa]|uniref:NADPH:adrenodoxin oxidoreductase, mitochondrial n=1 Tax=Heterodermia speciosa TaxID=116794 RepID=A0A8H3IVW1_9LECA|nr:MAG: NADPH-adrenodoxin reductase [Heterodermia speciosa]